MILDLTGIILGAAAGAASVLVVSKQLTGLTILAILAPTLWLLTTPIRQE